MTDQSMARSNNEHEQTPDTWESGDEPARPAYQAGSLQEILYEVGRDEAALEMALVALEGRCGELDQWLLDTLEEMNRTILEDLIIYPPANIEQARTLLGRYGFTKLALAWRAKGCEEEAKKLTRLALEGRFETLDPAIYQAIYFASEATLHEVIKHANRESLEQIRARLGLEG